LQQKRIKKASPNRLAFSLIIKKRLYFVAVSVVAGQQPAAASAEAAQPPAAASLAQHGLGQSAGQGFPQQSCGGFPSQHGSVRPIGQASALNPAFAR